MTISISDLMQDERGKPAEKPAPTAPAAPPPPAPAVAPAAPPEGVDPETDLGVTTHVPLKGPSPTKAAEFVRPPAQGWQDPASVAGPADRTPLDYRPPVEPVAPASPSSSAVADMVAEERAAARQDDELEARFKAWQTSQSNLTADRGLAVRTILQEQPNLDPQYVADHLEELNAQRKQEGLERALIQSPALRSYFSDPARAAYVKDELADASMWEWLFGRWQRTPADQVVDPYTGQKTPGTVAWDLKIAPAWARALKGGWTESVTIPRLSMKQLLGQATPEDLAELDRLEKEFQGRDYGAHNPLTRGLIGAPKMVPYIVGSTLFRLAGGAAGALVAGGAGAGGGAAAGAPAAGVGAVPGAAAGAVGGVGAGVGIGQFAGGAAFDFLESVGPQYRALVSLKKTDGSPLMSDAEARTWAIGSSAALAGITSGIAGAVVKRIPVVKTILERAVTQSVEKALVEQTPVRAAVSALKSYGEHVALGGAYMAVNGAGQTATSELAKLSHSQDASIAPVFQSALHGFTAGVQDMALLALWGPGREYLRQRGLSIASDAYADQLNKIHEQATKSPLLEKDQAAAEELFGKLALAQNAPRVLVDPAGWDSYWLGQEGGKVDPRAMAAKILDDGGAMYDQVKAGLLPDLSFPMEKWSARLGKPAKGGASHALGLAPDTKLSGETRTPRQQAEWVKQQQKIVESLAGPAGQKERNDQLDGFQHAKYLELLAGDRTPDEADAVSRLFRDALDHFSRSENLEPRQVLERYPLRFRGRDQAAPALKLTPEPAEPSAPKTKAQAPAAPTPQLELGVQGPSEGRVYTKPVEELGQAAPAPVEASPRPAGGDPLAGVEGVPQAVRDQILDAFRGDPEALAGMSAKAKEAIVELARGKVAGYTDALVPELGNQRAHEEFMKSPQAQGGVHVVTDMPGLKARNDSLGQQAGDQAIRAYGRAFSASSRAAGGKAHRMSTGDEFYAWFPDQPSADAFLRSFQARLAGPEGTLRPGDQLSTYAGVGPDKTAALAQLVKAKGAAKAKHGDSRKGGAVGHGESFVFRHGDTQEAAPAAPGAREQGAATRIVTPQRPDGEPARYAVMEATDLVPSHLPDSFQPDPRYPAGVQEREYHRQQEEQAKVVQGAQKLNPALVLSDTPSAVDGPPIVTSGKAALVMGGNGRAMMLARAMGSEDTRTAYREQLLQKASSFGLDRSAIEKMRAPVLVRVLDEVKSTSPKEELVAAVRRTNEGMTQALSPRARAVAEAKNLSPETVHGIGQLLAEASDSSLRDVMRDSPAKVVELLRRDGLITDRNSSSWLASGQLTEEAKDRVEGMFLGRVLGSGDRMAATPPALQGKLERIATALVRVQGVNPEMDEIPTVQAAVDLLNDAKRRNQKLGEILAQGGMFSSTTIPPAVANMARLLDSTKPKELERRFAGWANETAFDPRQATMFAPNPSPDQARATLFRDDTGTGVLFQPKQQRQASLRSIRDFAEKAGATLDAFESNGRISLSRIVVDERGKGTGTEIMRRLTDYADRTGQAIELDPSTDFGASSRARLVRFYKRFGFVENKGRNRDLEVSSDMYRKPTDASILHQGQRGEIRFQVDPHGDVAGFDVRLLEADESTAAHELGHWMGLVLGQLASRPEASEVNRKLYASALELMGYADHAERRKALVDSQELRARDAAAAEGKGPPLTDEERARLQAFEAKEEKFSHAFELYLAKGEAPTVGLARVFARFKLWMVRIYSGLQSIGAVRATERAQAGISETYRAQYGQELHLSEGVRKMFDRLLGGEEALRDSELDQDARKIEEAIQALPQADADEIRQAQEEARRVAGEQLQRLLLEEGARERRQFMSRERERISEDVAKELDAQPGYQAVRFLREGVMPEGRKIPAELVNDQGEPRMLDRQEAIERYGADFVRQNLRGMTSKDASKSVPMDLMAEHFGFSSGDELVRELAKLPSRGEVIRTRTQEKLEGLYGPDLLENPQKLGEAALAAAHNEKAASAIITGMRILARRLAPDLDPRFRAIDLVELEARARQFVREKPLLEVSTARQLQAERRARLRAVELLGRAARAKDEGTRRQFAGEAFDAHELALFNQYLWRASRDQLEQATKDVGYLRGFLSDKARAKIGDAGFDYLDRIDDLLGSIELRASRSVAEVQRRRAINAASGGTDPTRDVAPNPQAAAAMVAWLEQQKALNRDPYVPDRVIQNLQKTQHWRELSGEELGELRDSVESIAHLAKVKTTLLDGKERRERKAILGELTQRLFETFGDHQIVVDRNTLSAKKRVLRAVKRLQAGVIRPEEFFREADGGQLDGPFTRYLWNPVNDATHAWSDLAERVQKPVIEELEKMPLADKLRWRNLRFSVKGQPYTMEAALAVALNWGNASNRMKITQGWKYGGLEKYGILPWDGEATAQEFMKHLTKADWDLVQRIWDQLDSLRPAMEALDKRMTGLAPKWITPDPFTAQTADGQTVALRGGYYPMVYDRRFSRAGAAQGEKNDLGSFQLYQPGAERAITPHGHLQARVEEFARPVDLSLTGLYRHLSHATKDVAMREALISVHDIITDGNFRAAIQRTAGEQVLPILDKWVRDVANDLVLPDGGEGLWLQFVNGTRRGLTGSVFAFNAAQALQNLTGVANVTARIDAKYLWKGISRISTERGSAIDWIKEQSGMMRHRARNLDRDVREGLERNLGKRGARARANEIAMWAFQSSDAVVSYAAWLGAYHQALDGKVEGVEATHEMAVRWADQTVSLALIASATKDLPALMRSPAGKWFTMFGGWGNARLNDLIGVAADTKRDWSDQAYTRALRRLTRVTFWVLAGAVLSDLAVGKGPSDDNDDGKVDGADWARWVARRATLAPLSIIPIGGQVAKSIADGRKDVSLAPIERVYSLAAQTGIGAGKLAKALWEGDDWGDELKNFGGSLTSVAGMAAGLPVGQARATLGYWLADDRDRRDSLLAKGLGTLYGPKRTGSLNAALTGED